MAKVFVALVALMAAVACASANAISAYPASVKQNPFGIVEGIENCGSDGTLGTVDVTDCTQVPCRFVPNHVYDVAIKFRASVTSDTLVLIIYRLVPGGDDDQLLEVPIDGTIEAGVEYELKFKLPITTEFAGKNFNIRFYVIDHQNNKIEICAQAPVEVAPAKLLL